MGEFVRKTKKNFMILLCALLVAIVLVTGFSAISYWDESLSCNYPEVFCIEGIPVGPGGAQ